MKEAAAIAEIIIRPVHARLQPVNKANRAINEIFDVDVCRDLAAPAGDSMAASEGFSWVRANSDALITTDEFIMLSVSCLRFRYRSFGTADACWAA